MSDTVAVLLGLAWVLILGPLFLLWWLPDHLEVRELKRRSAARQARFAPTRSGTRIADRFRRRAGSR